MHGALAPGKEPKSNLLKILSTTEVAIGLQTPVHDTTPVSGGEDEVTKPESSWSTKQIKKKKKKREKKNKGHQSQKKVVTGIMLVFVAGPTKLD